MAAKSGSKTIEDVLGESDGLTIEQALAGLDQYGESGRALHSALNIGMKAGDMTGYGMPTEENARSGFMEVLQTPGKFILRRAPAMIGALVGNKIGGKLMEKIPALAGIGWKQALGRIGLLSGSEGAGAGIGDLTGQFLSGDEVDPVKAGLTAAIQSGLGVANSATAAGSGRAGAVSPAAVEAGMGRPGFAKAPAPGEYAQVVRDIHKGFEPTSPGRVDLEGTIQSFDNQDFHVEGGKLLDAMGRELPSGSAPENIAARSKMLGEIENHRAEIERLAQKHQIDPVRVLGAPAVNIPGETTAIPAIAPREPVNVTDYQKTPIKNEFGDVLRVETQPVDLQIPGTPGVPAGERVTPGVNILPSPETLIPPDLRAAEGRAIGQVPRPGTANMRLPLTGRQADSFIRENLTAPIAEDLAGNPGGSEYIGARKALRGRVASEFYDQLGIGASESAKRAKNVLDVKDLVADKYFPVDERGVPRPTSAERIASVGRNNSPGDAIYREHLQSIDQALGTKLVDTADRLSQKQEWSPNDQREAAFLLDAYRATSGRVVTTGGFRGFLRLIGRAALRSQGKTGALIRGAAAGDISDRIRPDKEKRRIGPTL